MLRPNFKSWVIAAAIIVLAAVIGGTLSHAAEDADLIRQGTEALKQGRYENAIESFSAAIRLAPTDATAWRRRGIAYAGKGDYDHAITDYDQSLLFDSSNSHTYTYLGNAWLESGSYDRARKNYDKAIELDPRNAYAYVCRGFASAKLLRYDEAIADYDRAIQLQPDYKAAFEYRAFAQRQRRRHRLIWITDWASDVGWLVFLFAAVRAYRFPMALSHKVNGDFARMPDGTLVFSSMVRPPSYVVPDSDTERRLRSFSRRSAAATLACICLFMLLSELLELTPVVKHWIYVPGWFMNLPFGVMAIVPALGFGALTLCTAANVRGLSKITVPGAQRTYQRWLNDLALDLPLSLRLVATAMVVLFSARFLLEFAPSLSLNLVVEQMSIWNVVALAPILAIFFFLAWFVFLIWQPAWRHEASP